MNKATREAITHGHPMRWEMDAASAVGRLNLVATTYTYESGAVRTRKVWSTYNAKDAHFVHGEIVRQGGKVSEPTPKALYERWQEEE